MQIKKSKYTNGMWLIAKSHRSRPGLIIHRILREIPDDLPINISKLAKDANLYVPELFKYLQDWLIPKGYIEHDETRIWKIQNVKNE